MTQCVVRALRQRTINRPGKSLIEVMVVITVVSVVLAACTTTLAALLHVERQFRRDAEQTVALSRLAARIRSDAHQATGLQAGDACMLSMPGGAAIHYAADGRAIIREVRRGMNVEHRDAFRLPGDARIAFAAVEQPGGQLLRLTIRGSGRPVPGLPTVQDTTIDAAIGLSPAEAQP
jgi:type II secretory pathway pseudopilin PulG